MSDESFCTSRLLFELIIVVVVVGSIVIVAVVTIFLHPILTSVCVFPSWTLFAALVLLFIVFFCICVDSF